MMARHERDSFGVQHTAKWGSAVDGWFNDPQAAADWKNGFLNALAISETELEGKLVLDAGTGPGQVPFALRHLPCTVVGLDITAALSETRRRLSPVTNVHLVRADLRSPPFAPRTFDYVHCLGVLHHTPDPAASFRRLAEMVRPGGKLLVTVNSAEQRNPWMLLRAVLRPLTRHLPLKMTYWICWLLGVPLTLAINAAVWLASTLGASHTPGGRFLGVTYGSLGRRSRGKIAASLFDTLTPPYYSRHTLVEVEGWFRDAGFEKVERTYPLGVCLCGSLGDNEPADRRDERLADTRGEAVADR